MLHCEVNNTEETLQVSWRKDGTELVEVVPHIFIRSSITSSNTILLLVVDYFQLSDSGTYQCKATDSDGNEQLGSQLQLSGGHHSDKSANEFIPCSVP